MDVNKDVDSTEESNQTDAARRQLYGGCAHRMRDRRGRLFSICCGLGCVFKSLVP